jgi:hypothetical protein
LRSLWSRSPLTTSRVSSLGSYGLVRRYLRQGFRLWDLLVSFAVTYVKGFVFGIFWSRSPLPTSRVSSLGFIRQGSSLRLRQGFRPWDNVKGFVPKITSSSQR